MIEIALHLTDLRYALFHVETQFELQQKTQISLEKLKVILQVKCNFSNTCEEFYNNISENNELLKKVNCSEKYI